MTRVNWSATIRSLRIADERHAIQNNTPLLRKSHMNIWIARERHNSPETVPVLKKDNAICNRMIPIRIG